MHADPDALADDPATEAMRQRVAGSNISPVTLLATDYLNHFNEIAMLLELLPDMPDMLEEAKAWQPKSYVEHFQQSTIADRDLAVACWPVVPSRFKAPFEKTIETLNLLIPQIIDHAELLIASGDQDRLQHRIRAGVQALHLYIESASGIIHGSDRTLDQGEIDRLLR